MWNGDTVQAKKCIRDTPHPFEPIKGFLKEYADPNKADKMSAVQENLDQIKSIMHKNIEDVKFYNSTLLLLCEFAGIHNLSFYIYTDPAKRWNIG